MRKTEIIDVFISGLIAVLALNISSYILLKYFPEYDSANIYINIILIMILLIFREQLRSGEIKS